MKILAMIMLVLLILAVGFVGYVSIKKLFFMETVLLRLEMISILGRGKKL